MTIWALGISMIALSALVYLPQKYILVISCILIFGHNLLDTVHFNDNILWSIIHEFGFYNLSNTYHFIIGYPMIPWIAVMSLGYCFGSFYDQSFDSSKRRKIFNLIGIFCVLLFFIIRWVNQYGDPYPWEHFDTLKKDIISFMNPTKYPPSLLFLLITIGATLLFLANSEKLKGKIVNFFTTFGRVPFFYYILHLYVIHLLAMIFAQLTGFGFEKLILTRWITNTTELKGYGVNLWTVYLIWVSVIVILYPLSKKFDDYKQNNKNKWWLSYL